MGLEGEAGNEAVCTWDWGRGDKPKHYKTSTLLLCLMILERGVCVFDIQVPLTISSVLRLSLSHTHKHTYTHTLTHTHTYIHTLTYMYTH